MIGIDTAAPPRWVAALDGDQIVALQHGCGQDNAPVNCYVDEYRNWVCPHCMATYGAAVPLDGWKNPLLVPKVGT